MRGILALLALGASLAVADAPDTSPERIGRLIAQLASAKFSERESATRSLDAIGEPALELLQAAEKSGDPEARRRAGELAERIGQRVGVARLLKPTLVKLDIIDQPMDAAVKSLAQSTGLAIELPQSAKFAGRRVSVRSEPLPVWDAVEHFCRKADLQEWDGASPLPGVSPPQEPRVGPIRGGQLIVNGRAFVGSAVSTPTRVVLLDGPSQSWPQHSAGAVRLRVLPHGTPFPLETRADDVVLPIQPSAESRLQWAGAMSVRVDRAIDELGVRHEATGVLSGSTAAEDTPFIVMPNGVIASPPNVANAGRVALKIARGDRAAKKLSTLSGEMTAEIRVNEPLVHLAAPLQDGGSATATSGASVKLIKVVNDPANEWKLTVQTQPPVDINPANVVQRGGGRIFIQGGIVLQPQGNAGGKVPSLADGTTEFQGLSLEDANGRRWPAIAGMQESSQIGPQGMVHVIQVTFRAPAADAAPHRLVFCGTRPVVVSIPFTFRDVPLP